MRIASSIHRSRPWRIHEIAHDFRLEDVWRLDTPGRREDFPRLVELFASVDPSQFPSTTVRTLFAIRGRLGELFGWDAAGGGLGSSTPALRDRLPDELRDGSARPQFRALPFRSLYLTDDEWAAEVANRTVHGVLHIGWVPDESGAYHGEMAVYVKRNGLLGAGYMAAIAPFRHLVVYPPMLRELAREWRERMPRVEPVGLEPTTSRMQTGRSSS